MVARSRSVISSPPESCAGYGFSWLTYALGPDELLFVGIVRDGDIFDLFSFRQFREVNIDGFGHRRDRRGRSHGFDLDTGIDRCTQRAFAEGGDAGNSSAGKRSRMALTSDGE